MERIEFSYTFTDENDNKEVVVSKSVEDGIHDYEVCEMFMDFMRSVGFNEENVENYFNE